MAGFGFDSGYGQGVSYGGEAYIVLQVVLTERFLGTGSGVSSLTNLQNVINDQVAKGYRLHTITTAASGSKGWLGGDKIQATMVFERVDLYMNSNHPQNVQQQAYQHQNYPQNQMQGNSMSGQQGFGQQRYNRQNNNQGFSENEAWYNKK